MPRKTKADPADGGRPLTKRAARVTDPQDLDGPDRHPPQHIWRPAGSYPPIDAPTAPVSPFVAAGGKPVVKQTRPSLAIRVDAAQIEHGVPLPEVVPGFKSRYQTLLDRMGPGDMVRLPRKQAATLLALMKKQHVKGARRRLSPEIDGVWRLA